ncbi:hypothetical protein [Alloalcanivorax mobilis]|uniref:hypothetical protein n=1 Tax=Alloalcanivorax mobilis TaxID=2019569 RepID=UPI000C7719BA|nr:hypothetical protein [Alloalcanivorax mobilis]
MDHRRTLAPGELIQIKTAGDYIYCKWSDRPVRVLIEGEPVEMMTGDLWRPAGGFNGFEVENRGNENPVAVIFTVGRGSYNRQTIQGEVTVNPGIRGRDGQFVDDTRSTVALRVALGNITPVSYNAGQQMAVIGTGLPTPANGRPIPLDDGRIVVGNYSAPWRVYDPEGGYSELAGFDNDAGDAMGVQVGRELWIAVRETLPTKHVAIWCYDAAALSFRRKFPTGLTGGYLYLRAMTVGDGRIYVKTEGASGQSDTVVMMDMSGTVLRQVSVDHSTKSLVVYGGLLYMVGVGGFDNAAVILDAVTLETVPESEGKLPAMDGAGTLSGVALDHRGDLIRIGSTGVLSRCSATDQTLTVSGSVSSCAGAGMLRRDRVVSRALVAAERQPNGSVMLSGELLRAALEIYTGRFMPADYLDYVYAVVADNLNGISPRVIDAGGQSFAAAGLVDDAYGTFPQTLKITLREGLL